MLSTHEMNKLKITNRVGIMNLRLHCCTYCRQKPEKNRVGCDASEFDIPKSVLVDHLEQGFTFVEVSCFQSVKEQFISEWKGL